MKTVCQWAIGFIVLFLFSGAAFANNFRARLSGDNEVPTPVVTATTGKARVKFKDGFVKFFIKLKDAVQVTQAHIHCAPDGENGPIVVFLAGFHGNGWNVRRGKWVQAEFTNNNIIPVNTTDMNENDSCPNSIGSLADLLDAVEAGNAYVNVHSVANPGGEVRGQLE